MSGNRQSKAGLVEIPADRSCVDRPPHRFRRPVRDTLRVLLLLLLIFTADNWLKSEYNPAGSWGAAGHAFVGVADRITGPYENITWLRGAGCDTTLFGDDDGKTYAFIPRGGIDMQEIDLASMRLTGRPERILAADNTDIGVAAKPEYLEGPWVEKIGDTYVLFYAAIHREEQFPDWKGYWTGVAYSKHPMGPWRKDPRGRVFPGGHLAVFTDADGRPCFSHRGEGDDDARGRLCITPFEMTPNGVVVPGGIDLK